MAWKRLGLEKVEQESVSYIVCALKFKFPPGLNRLRKKSFLKVEGNTGAKEAAEKVRKASPRGLKSARRIKNKRLRRWPKEAAEKVSSDGGEEHRG
jgi:hypothetical protein